MRAAATRAMVIAPATLMAMAVVWSSASPVTVTATSTLRYWRFFATRMRNEECDRLAGVLYTKGLTQEQVGDVFDEIYGEHYSKSSISRMVDSIRAQVSSWLERDYTVEEAWDKWQEMCDKWGKDYRSIKLLRNNADYKAYLTYLNYAPEIQSMIYTTNWIERLNRDFRRVTRMRTAMPNEDSVITLMGSVAIDHKAFDRKLPGITCDKQLFPD